MLTIDIPGRPTLELTTLLLDLNGTIAFDGALLAEVERAIAPLRDQLGIAILTADTHGRAAEIAGDLGVGVRVVERGRETESKLDAVNEIGASSVVVIGNGANDALALEASALGIAVVGGEGLAFDALVAADVVVGSISDALGLLARPSRLVATLRR